MGGHGGLNILPQKRWNVYNFDSREKVRRDEEAAARDEQLKRDDSRRRDAELRLDRLRNSRGLAASSSSETTPASSDSGHINLFEGLHGFSYLGSAANDGGDARSGGKKFKGDEAEDGGARSGKKRKREDRTAATAAAADDEKYKLGYGLVGKGVKTPWYLSKASSLTSDDAGEGVGEARMNGSGKKKNGSGKKSIEELREERSRREKKEKERERGILDSIAKKEKGFSRRRFSVDRRRRALGDGSTTMCLGLAFALGGLAK